MLVNMITGDSQQLGILLRWSTNIDAFTPWSFEIFVLGLDIILPTMREENFNVLLDLEPSLTVDSQTSDSFLDFTAKNV
jgi:hypothetical protein